MRSAEDLSDVEGWYDPHTGTWHAYRTCTRNDPKLMPLTAALSNGHKLCRVCCRKREWYAAAMEAQDE